MPQDDKRDNTQETWVKVGEVFKEIVDRLERQQNERVERLKQALEEVE